jgi:hypothetical protein
MGTTSLITSPASLEAWGRGIEIIQNRDLIQGFCLFLHVPLSTESQLQQLVHKKQWPKWTLEILLRYNQLSG